MTQSQFIEECGVRTLNPALAIENEAVEEALRARDDKAVLEALDNEF